MYGVNKNVVFLVSLHTGEEVKSSAEYNHMQLDCVSLYLLYLVQMITSGLEIIYRYPGIRFGILSTLTPVQWIRSNFLCQIRILS